MPQFFGVKYKMTLKDKDFEFHMVYNTPESIKNIPEAGTKMKLPEFLKYLGKANDIDLENVTKTADFEIAYDKWRDNFLSFLRLGKHPYSGDVEIEILAKGQCPDSVIEKYRQDIKI